MLKFFSLMIRDVHQHIMLSQQWRNFFSKFIEIILKIGVALIILKVMGKVMFWSVLAQGISSLI